MKTRVARKANEYETEVINPFAKVKNIQISESAERKLVTLRIYGEIQEPEEYIEEIARLDNLSNKYGVIEVVLNSPGGSLNTTVDIATVIKKFECIVTIGKGEVASAAFMLWTMGDIRVVTDYSMYMSHRESYGMYGKTAEHKDAANVFGKVYEELFDECFGDLLTDKEKEIAERSETWISYKDLLEREAVIHYDDYMTPRNAYMIGEIYKLADNRRFLYDEETDTIRSVTIIYGDEFIDDMTGYLYGICNVEAIEYVEDEVEVESTDIIDEKTNIMDIDYSEIVEEKNVKSSKRTKKDQ